jgi:hypothetical protein
VPIFYELFGLRALTAGGDGPRQANFGEVLQEFASPREGCG